MPQKVHLLVIDPQSDFCHPDGALFVPGADEDMKRLSTMVRDKGKKIHRIHVTLDSHHEIDVAHPIMWRDSSGNHPSPFTIISNDDMQNGNWAPTKPGDTKRLLDYTAALETGGRYPLCIWPPHCRIGSWGHTVVPELFDAFSQWEKDKFWIVDYVTKGSNPYTEHYSGVRAECEDPQDPTTQINTKLIQTLMDADIIGLAGEASSHCVRNTIFDIASAFGDDSYISKVVLLEDATSPVPGFENLQDDFIKELTGRGMKLSTTVDFLS